MVCTPCTDIVQGWVGRGFSRYNYLGDVVILVNLVLLLITIGLQRVDKRILWHVVVIAAFLFVFRFLLVMVTTCEIDNNRDHYSVFGKDHTWYMLSGHTITSILIVYVLASANVPKIIPIISGILALATMLLQIMLREHKTSDILLAAAITGLTLRAFPTKNYRASV